MAAQATGLAIAVGSYPAPHGYRLGRSNDLRCKKGEKEMTGEVRGHPPTCRAGAEGEGEMIKRVKSILLLMALFSLASAVARAQSFGPAESQESIDARREA